MRPSVLDPLFASATALDGVGPKLAGLLRQLLDRGEDEARVRDLLFHLPSGLIDRRRRAEIATAPESVLVTLVLRIDRHQAPSRAAAKTVPYRVFGQDETGEIALTYFRGQAQWLEKLLPIGETMIVSGRVEWFNGRPSMVHPDFVAPLADAETMPMVEPVYPLTAGLSAKVLRKAIGGALERLQPLPEWIDPGVARKQTFPSFETAVRKLHTPESEFDIALASTQRRRLAYDEFLAGQLALALSRQRMKKAKGRPLRSDGSRLGAVRAALPFALTNGQEQALAEILKDMAEEDRMLRLLQGDVGSGKTAVALCAFAAAAEAGAQSTLLAPTEILARQHHAGLAELCRKAGLHMMLLTGRDKGAARREKLERIASGETDIVVGTHALFQDDVDYHDLGLVVVDEQHRFGVHQRLALARKGQTPDLLVMTATPIPRTLVLASFGDMDVSRLTEKPAGRKPVTTVAVPFDRLDEIIGRAGRAMDKGERLYWVCPLVEESDKSELVAAEARFHQLRAEFGDRVGLVHGRMSGEEKDAAMAAFKAGRTQLIVATTVIEVGVDVPDASIIVIEHAERFGLSQLHQLRGRVGRSDKPSTCVLLYKAPLGETAKARIAVMRETEDGFRIAEEDLRLRGEGDLLGTKQSGLPGFKLASLEDHADLLEIARDDARMVMATDPQLETERGAALRILLYLFGRDEAIRLLRAG